MGRRTGRLMKSINKRQRAGDCSNCLGIKKKKREEINRGESEERVEGENRVAAL